MVQNPSKLNWCSHKYVPNLQILAYHNILHLITSNRCHGLQYTIVVHYSTPLSCLQHRSPLEMTEYFILRQAADISHTRGPHRLKNRQEWDQAEKYLSRGYALTRFTHNNILRIFLIIIHLKPAPQ